MFWYQCVLGTAIFTFGMIIGSFLNVVIYRLGSGIGFLGRSKCLSCGSALTARMLVPILSYVFQRGKCIYCGARISPQYPLIEATSGVLFLLVWWVHDFDPMASTMLSTILYLFDSAIWALLLIIVAYDLKHKIILDRLTILFAFLAGASLFLKWYFDLLDPHFLPFLGVYISAWADAFAGPILALPFTLLWFLSGGRAMGLGDAKLALGLGWFLGFSGGVSAVILAFWLAFFPSLFLLFLSRKRFTMKSEIPFAPFLVLGTLIVFVWGIDILRWTI